MNLQERLEQCRKDKAAITKLEEELLQQIKTKKEKKREPKLGEIVESDFGERIFLFDLDRECLRAYDKHGKSVGSTHGLQTEFYRYTGKTIFDLLK